MNWTKQLIWLGICGLLTNDNRAAETLVGPFLPKSGHYTLVPGGSFESDKSISAEGWSGSFSLTGSVVLKLSPELPYEGTNSLKSLVNIAAAPSTNGWSSIFRTITLQGGETYALSAFFYTAFMSGAMYLDLADPFFQPRPYKSSDVARAEGGIRAWQFGWSTFTVPSSMTNVTVRFNHKGFSSVGEHGYVDDIAVTLLREFVPPVPIASSEASLQIGLFAGIQIEGTVGRTYRIEYSATLPGTNWIALTNLSLPSSSYFFLDLSSTDQARRFYRAFPLE